MKSNVQPKLGKILKERGITQKQFSEMTGIPQPTISRFDRSGQHTDSHLFIISKTLNLKMADLFEIK